MITEEKARHLRSMNFMFDHTSNWGAIHVFDSKNTIKDLRVDVIDFYRSIRLEMVEWSSQLSGDLEDDVFSRRMKALFPDDNSLDLRLAGGGIITDDEVYVLPQATDGWVAVMSRALEWTLPGENPLALFLSKKRDILSTTFIEDNYTDISLYRDGALVCSSLHGPIIENPSDTFEWGWFEGKGNVVPPAELQSESRDLEICLNLAGPSARGHREAMSAAPIFDYGADQYLVFRRP